MCIYVVVRCLDPLIIRFLALSLSLGPFYSLFLRHFRTFSFGKTYDEYASAYVYIQCPLSGSILKKGRWNAQHFSWWFRIDFTKLLTQDSSSSNSQNTATIFNTYYIRCIEIEHIIRIWKLCTQIHAHVRCGPFFSPFECDIIVDLFQ